MEQQHCEELKLLCRLCLNANDKMRNIFYDGDWCARDISPIIFECTNIKVTQNDGATRICFACIDELTTIIKFRRKCVKINEYLKCRYSEPYCNAVAQSSAQQEHTNSTDIIFLDLGDEQTLLAPNNTTEILIDNHSPDSQNDMLEDSTDGNESVEENNLKCKYKLKGVTKNQEFTNVVDWPKIRKRDLIEKKAYRGLCHICGREFQHLWVHLQFHNSTPTDTCDICGKGFKSKANLQLHILMHKDAELPCEICGKKYRTKMRLKRHSRVHTGNRPFTCQICHKKFYTKYNLEVHARSHTGEKPFSCKYCNEKFTHSYSLKNHYDKNHKDPN